MHDANCFITLTYSDENLPEDGSLVKDDWKKFAKRLRHRAGPFRFMMCGEYGDRNYRPHFHACIHGLDFLEDRVFYKNTPLGHRLYISPTLERAWGKGFAPIGELTKETAAYVARYVVKKLTGERCRNGYIRVDPVHGTFWQVEPEFGLMSRNPGLGKEWIKKYAGDVYPRDEVVVNGRRHKPPRYYDDQQDPAVLEEVRKKRAARTRRRLEKGDITPERLRVREKVFEKRTNRLKRKY